MAIFVDKGLSQGPQTRGVRLLDGCIYHAEYGMENVIPLYLYASLLNYM